MVPVWADCVLGGPDSQMTIFSKSPYMVHRESKISQDSYKDCNPILEGSILKTHSNLNYVPKHLTSYYYLIRKSGFNKWILGNINIYFIISFIGPLSHVYFLVLNETGALAKRFPTFTAFIRPFSRVNFPIFLRLDSLLNNFPHVPHS